MEAKKRGRPSQDKVIRPYTIDRKIADFISGLPDGDRSRFVNNILIQGIEIEKISGKYYNYFLMRPDGSVFYVGKGTGNRINDHEIEARAGVQSHKCNIIRKIWADGGQVLKQKIAFFDVEEDAYALEILLISFFGRENLANKTNGGEGNSTGEERVKHVDLTLSIEVLSALQEIADELKQKGEIFNRSRFIDDWIKKHPVVAEKLQKKQELGQ